MAPGGIPAEVVLVEARAGAPIEVEVFEGAGVVPLGTDVFPLTCFRNVPGPAKMPQDPSSRHFPRRAPQKVTLSPVLSITLQHLLNACLQVACLASASSVETPRLI